MNQRRSRPWTGRLPLLLALAPLLAGFNYGTRVLVQTEGDIHDLQYSGEISAEMAERLQGLIEEPLDINSASREDLYQLPDVTYGLADKIIEHRHRERFTHKEQLKEILPDQIWRQVQPFIDVDRPQEDRRALRGQVTLRGLERFDDDKIPTMYVKARQSYRRWLDAGVIVAEEHGVLGADYSTTPISVEGVGPVVRLERFHISAERDGWSMIVGHYMAGFGERLTFDVTNRTRSRGFYHDLNLYETSVNYDSYHVPERLFGVAASIERDLGGPTLTATAFLSSNHQDLYESYWDPGYSPKYVVTGTDEVKYATFYNLYREDIVGLNTTLDWSRHASLGFTAWGGHIDKEVDFAIRGTSLPNRPFYGAAGVHGSGHLALADFYGEVAVTDTGGTGARGEAVLNPTNTELSLAFRYYGTGFDNPHTRGRAQPDTYRELYEYEYESAFDAYKDGVETGSYRVRDEVGPQARIVAYPFKWLMLGLNGDVWRRMSTDITNAYGAGRLGLDPLEWLGFDIIGSLRDEDISLGGGEPGGGDGRPPKLGAGVGARVVPVDAVILQAFVKENYDPPSNQTYSDSHDLTRYWWLKGMFNISDSVRLATRYKRHDVHPGEDTGQKWSSVYGQASVELPGRITIMGRYERRYDIDTPDAEYSPEQFLKVGMDLRY